jgi:hypothetical protein
LLIRFNRNIGTPHITTAADRHETSQVPAAAVHQAGRS